MDQALSPGLSDLDRRYVDLLKKSLTRQLSATTYSILLPRRRTIAGIAYQVLNALVRAHGYEVVRRGSALDRREGRDWPLDAETMVGGLRLDNLEECVGRAVRDDVPGDLIECGVWRGGSAILMRALLEVYGDKERRVWVADSFRGLPKPDPARYPVDAGDLLHQRDQLAVSLEEVKDNFARYGYLDERVRFLEGWFEDVLPAAPIEKLSVLRVDGDMYKSTMEALESLYPKLSRGGFAIIDDYGAMPSCKLAVDDFRLRQGVSEPIEPIDWTGVFWRRTA